jgi:hypothetical protein
MYNAVYHRTVPNFRGSEVELECYRLPTRKCPLCNHQSHPSPCIFRAFHNRRLPASTSLTFASTLDVQEK